MTGLEPNPETHVEHQPVPGQDLSRRQIDALIVEANALRASDPQRSLVLSELACDQCVAAPFLDFPYRAGQAAALFNLGHVHLNAARPDKSLTALLPAGEIFEYHIRLGRSK